ncbi:prephenate dehydrogenase/arogenate dehydrogenase family protein [Xylanimonas allomyrinae]|uniref:Prephenate dehydrogenase/arogenate dehydrogenase family protein n=1 Tax=Xylanimonas allomyrinae TaxID=2509459 RepID=A0A4V0YEL8_9MICO|nr:prephenate dehydrogenase/arogenate dehydrogenase family protein [Xylanimonas allomyrinae]
MFEHVAVLGLGLVGGSLARLLAARGVTVVGQDVDAATVAAARATGLTATGSVAEAVAGADLVVLAVPLRAMRATAAEVARHLADDVTLTDVGSVKSPVRQAVEAAGLGDRFVGAHPMAGTERSGFAASSAGLLDGAPWAVTAPARGAGDAAERLARILRLVTGPLGGTAAVLTDDVHDEAVALVSHVPHVLATQLLNAVAGAPVRDAALGLAAGSFRDGTRVAFTDPARTEAMVTENAAWVAPALRKTIRDLEALVAALETNASVHQFFHDADLVRATSGRTARTSLTPQQPVALTGDWPATLTARCARGERVTSVTATQALLAR